MKDPQTAKFINPRGDPHLGGLPKIGGVLKPPKMDGENNENPHEQMDDLRVP